MYLFVWSEGGRQNECSYWDHKLAPRQLVIARPTRARNDIFSQEDSVKIKTANCASKASLFSLKNWVQLLWSRDGNWTRIQRFKVWQLYSLKLKCDCITVLPLQYVAYSYILNSLSRSLTGVIVLATQNCNHCTRLGTKRWKKNFERGVGTLDMYT